MSAMRLVYFWADFSIGHWMRVWPVTARGGLVVSERWWWDMYVDPRRHRLQPMPRTARVLGRLVPQADAFLVLEAPSELILERKQELSALEIERQQAAWKQLAPAIRAVQVIDASAPLADVTDDVVRVVVERQGERIHGRPAPNRAHPSLRAVPKADPRWLVDPRDAATVSAAFHLYQPSRAIARSIVRSAEMLTTAAPIAARMLGLLGAEPSPEAISAVDRVREAVSLQITGEPLRIAAFLGSEGPARKLSAVVLDRNGDPAFFAKVASTAPAIAALENEARTLDGLEVVARSVVLPQVVSFESDAHGALLLLTPVAGSRMNHRAEATNLHVELISELLEVRRPFDGAAHRDALRARLRAAPETAESAFLQRALTLTEDIWPSVRSIHFSHGDLTPWNCLDCGGALGVVDWEMAGYRLPGWDAVHYVAQIEAITHAGPLPEAVERLIGSPFLARVGELVAESADIDPVHQDRDQALQLLCLIDGAVELLTTQPDISGRGIAVRLHAIARLLGVAPPRLEA